MTKELTIAECYKLIAPIVAERAEEYQKHGEPYRFDNLAGYAIAKAAHKLGLEEVALLRAEVRVVITNCLYCAAQERGTGACFDHVALRAALAEVE